MAECEHIASGQFPAPGVPGATFVPGVEEIPEGYEVSWENNRNLPNPDPVRLLHGKSAYQLAVEAGYEGTEVEFAAEMADAAVAKARAEAAAEAAGKSETNAAGSASAAAQSEQNAKDSEEAARQAAGEAAQLAQAAAGSAGAVSLSEQNAAASEQAAEDAAEEAGNRATAAGNAAGAAARSEANAKTSEENAARSEEEAKKAAQEAQGVILSGPAQPGQLLLVESVSEDGKLLNCTAVDRTHGEGTPVTVEVLPEATLTIPENDPATMALLGLVAGETYTVNWNGTAYECTATSVVEDGITASFIGNALAIGGTDNGVPFVIGDIPAQSMAMCMALDGSTQATVGITQVKHEIKKLAPKFLPDGVPYAEISIVDPTFDGSLEGKEYIDLGLDGICIVKVSDQILSSDEIVGSTIVGVASGGIGNVLITEDMIRTIDGEGTGVQVIYDGVPAVVAVCQEKTAGGMTFTTGTWFGYVPNTFYVKSLSCLNPVERKTYHKLDNGCLDLDWLPIKIPERKVLLAETTISSKYKVLDCPIHTLAAGDKVFVTYNGTTYTCALKVIDGNFAVGNLSLANAGADTGEPFLISGNDVTTQIQSDGSTYTLSIAADTYVYNTIPSGFLANSYYFPYDVTGYIPTAAINEARTALQNGGVVTCNLGTVLSIFDDGEQAFMWVAGSRYLYQINQPFALDCVPTVRRLMYEDNGWFNQALVLTSPNGTKYKLVVTDDGTLSTEAVTT